jgi:hypothetical protein
VISKEIAILSLRPNTEWVMNGGDVENIIWHTPNVEPLTEAEVQAEIVRLEQAQEAEQQAKIDAKASAMAKLSALGLNEQEVAALIN